MIKKFRHKGLQVFFETGSKSGIQPNHASKLKRQLIRLDLSQSPSDMNVPGWKLHQLSTGYWSIWVNGNWRMTFIFDGVNAKGLQVQEKNNVSLPLQPPQLSIIPFLANIQSNCPLVKGHNSYSLFPFTMRTFGIKGQIQDLPIPVYGDGTCGDLLGYAGANPTYNLHLVWSRLG